MDTIFLSKNNYGLLHELIKDTILKRYDYDIDKNKEANFLNKLFTIMKQIYNDRDKFNLSDDMSNMEKIKQLNKYTLDFIIPHFSKIIEHTIQKNPNSEEKNLKVNSRPEPSNFVDRNSNVFGDNQKRNDFDVLKNFNNMSNQRSEPLNRNKPESLDFSLPIDNSNFPMDKYNEMQKQRDLELKDLEEKRLKKEHSQPIVEKTDETVTVAGLDSTTNMNTHINKMEEFKKFNSLKEERDKKFENRLAELAKERDVVFKENQVVPKGNLVEEFSAINETEVIENFNGEKTLLDERNEGVYFKKTNFKKNPEELFKLDPNIEKQLLERKKIDVLKRDDLMIKQPVVTEIYTEYITVDSRDDLQLNATTPVSYLTKSEFSVYFPWGKFKNIKNITMTSALVPSTSVISDPGLNPTAQEPYLLVSILELGGSLYNSNNKNIKYFAKIYNDKNLLPATTTLSYAVDNTTKHYNIHNLSSLEKMTISVTDYRGNVIEFKQLNEKQCFSFTFKVDYTIGDANEHINSNMI